MNREARKGLPAFCALFAGVLSARGGLCTGTLFHLGAWTGFVPALPHPPVFGSAERDAAAGASGVTSGG